MRRRLLKGQSPLVGRRAIVYNPLNPPISPAFPPPQNLTLSAMNVFRFAVFPLSLLAAVSWITTTASAEPVEIGPLLAKLRAVGPKGAGHREAMTAWKSLSTADAEQLSELLAGMDGAGELPCNWICSAAETIAQRQFKQRGKLPVAALERFLGETSHHPRARRVAYELIAKVDSTAEKRLIPTLLDDPSLELRRDAVAQALDAAETFAKAEKKVEATAAYRKAFSASRDLDQIKLAAAALKKLGEKVDLPVHLGFLMQWKIVGPFDNTEMKAFDIAYEPEKKFDLAAEYTGKTGKIKWFDYSTKDDYGHVDLTVALDKHKGAVAYAYTEFLSDQDRPVELRLGCINANKVWLNGELLTANNVYHANTSVDQYIGKGKMKKGRNVILLKIGQNEQTEEWAQDWKFQLRVCDPIGTAILSQDRPLGQTASVRRKPLER